MKKKFIINMIIDIIIGMIFVTIFGLFKEIDVFSFCVGCSLILLWDVIGKLRK